MKWYVLKVASNKEQSVADALQRKVAVESVQDIVGRIVVPVERIKSVKGGKQRVIKRKLYPGYVFMELETDENGRVPEKVWFMIRETNGVGDFIGSEGKPTPMRDTDVAKMLVEIDEMTDNAPSIKVEFSKGDMVKIREGAFENFEGVVDEIDAERGIVRVNVSIFGRSTPLDIEYWQIEKQ